MPKPAPMFQEAARKMHMMGGEPYLTHAAGFSEKAREFSEPASPNAVAFYEGRYGTLAHLASDRCIGRSLELYGEWGESEIELLREYVPAASTVLDIGANVGTHTLAFARMVGDSGKVVAIEAQPEIYQLLCYNIVANGFAECVQSIQMLAGDKIDVIPYLGVTMPENLGARNFIPEYTSPPRTGTITLPMATIDSLPIENCSLMKIDVESMEPMVLRGAAALLQSQRPVVYFEHATGNAETLRSIHAMLTGFGYRLYWHLASPFNPQNYNRHGEDIFSGAKEINVLALHGRHRDDLIEVGEPFMAPAG